MLYILVRCSIIAYLTRLRSTLDPIQPHHTTNLVTHISVRGHRPGEHRHHCRGADGQPQAHGAQGPTYLQVCIYVYVRMYMYICVCRRYVCMISARCLTSDISLGVCGCVCVNTICIYACMCVYVYVYTVYVCMWVGCARVCVVCVRQVDGAQRPTHLQVCAGVHVYMSYMYVCMCVYMGCGGVWGCYGCRCVYVSCACEIRSATTIPIH